MNLEKLQNICMKTWRDIHFCVIYINFYCVHISFHKIKPNNSTIFVQELTVNQRDTQLRHRTTKEAKISTKAYFDYILEKNYRPALSSVYGDKCIVKKGFPDLHFYFIYLYLPLVTDRIILFYIYLF